MWVFQLNLAFASMVLESSSEDFAAGQPLNIFAGYLSSARTQVSFPHFHLNFCKNPTATHQSAQLSFLPYNLSMQAPELCREICTTSNTRADLQEFQWMIDNEYTSTWLIDSLPSGLRITLPSSYKKFSYYQIGIPIGFKLYEKYYIYNHHHIILKTYPHNATHWSIVGFLIEPLSFNSNEISVCSKYDFQAMFDLQDTYTEKIKIAYGFQSVELPKPDTSELQELNEFIQFSYSVTFEESRVKWARRWDIYVYSGSGAGHWLGIVNNFGLVMFLALFVAHFFRRVVKNDIRIAVEGVEAFSETGLKQIGGDVFRPPASYVILANFVSIGIQIVLVVVITLIFALFNTIYYQFFNELFAAAYIVYSATAIIPGYLSNKLCKGLNGHNWLVSSRISWLFFPIILFLLIIMIDFTTVDYSLSIFYQLSGTVLIVALSILGSFISEFYSSIIPLDYTTRNLEPPTSHQLSLITYLVSGFLPFACAIFEIHYIMTSVWTNTQVYYFFGFLLLTFVLTLLISAEVSALTVYFLIKKGDYRWWWTAFLTPALSGIYLLVYSVVYCLIYFDVTGTTSFVVYFGFMTVGSVAFAIVNGAVGAFASFWLMKKIFFLVKIE